MDEVKINKTIEEINKTINVLLDITNELTKAVKKQGERIIQLENAMEDYIRREGKN
jgi:hypothetical protein